MRGDTIRRMRAERRALKEQLRQASTLRNAHCGTLSLIGRITQ